MGRTAEFDLELRVDHETGIAVSGDVFVLEKYPRGSLSFRTRRPTGELESAQADAVFGEQDIEWTDEASSPVEGQICVEPIDDAMTSSGRRKRLDVRLSIKEDLGQIEAGTQFSVPVTWAGQGMRKLGLEVEIEDQVDAPAMTSFAGAKVSYEKCLERVGFDVVPAGNVDVIPAPEDGWNASDVYSVLNDVMTRAAQSSLTEPTWVMHLLVLSRSKRKDLLGLMFDDIGDLPRQGAAVFAGEIRERFPRDADRRIIQTAVHEIGHGLNLTHRFSRGVRRADSKSFMTYDWLYRGGGNSEAYWDDFDYTFDDDERLFLRHGPRHSIIPGGAQFGSARYWESGGADANPVPVVRTGLRLWLTPPPAGTSFTSGQPVFLEVSLHNAGATPMPLPRTVLDLKAGLLDVSIRRLGTGSASEPRPFTPIMRRCYDSSSVEGITVRPGESLHNNLNLVFGSAGFPFAEPGDYEVTPTLSLPAVDCDGSVVEAVVTGDPIRISVGASGASRDELELLAQPRVGTLMALGGARALAREQADLGELLVERTRRLEKPQDGVSAAIHRVAGIDAARRGDPELAVKHLSRALDPEPVRYFDPHTAQQTRSLAREQLAKLRPDTKQAPTVVVDLAATPWGGKLTGTDPVRVRVEAPLLADQEGGHAVLVPADRLPAGPLSIRATATVSAPDGVVEVVSVSKAYVLGPDDASAPPVLAKLFLARTVPTSEPSGLAEPGSEESAGDFLARHGGESAAQPLDDSAVRFLAPAATAAIDHAPDDLTFLSPADALTYFVHDHAAWRLPCVISPRCQPGDPGTADGPYPPFLRRDPLPCKGFEVIRLDDGGVQT